VIGQPGICAAPGRLDTWLGEYINEALRLQEQAHELYVAIGDPFRAALGDQGLGIILPVIGRDGEGTPPQSARL